jgi:hypothetical protein
MAERDLYLIMAVGIVGIFVALFLFAALGGH